MKGNNLPFPHMNTPAVEEQIPISEVGEENVYSVDDEGVLFSSQ
jgi:hypothetical protein